MKKGRGREAEGRSQKSEVRSQKSEVRRVKLWNPPGADDTIVDCILGLIGFDLFAAGKLLVFIMVC